MNSDHNDLEKIEDGLSNKLIYRITEKENTKIIIDFSKDKEEFKNFLDVYEILLKVNISIPKIYEVNQQQYKIYMQDFGNDRFNKILLAIVETINFNLDNSFNCDNSNNKIFKSYIKEYCFVLVVWIMPKIVK